MAETVSRQLSLFDASISEANLVQQALRDGFRGFATLNSRDSPSAPLRETRFPVSKMGKIIELTLRTQRETHDLYIAQHSYLSPKRTTASLLSLNNGHIDLDIYKTKWIEFSRDTLIQSLLEVLDRAGICRPTYIVSSGRGLQIKWIYSSPLTPRALARWQVAHRYLVENVLYDFGADIKAILPTQIMRLVGSRNLKGGEVGIVWVNGGDISNPVLYDFHEWANEILPYSKQQVQEFRLRMAQYDQWRAENNANIARLFEKESDKAGRQKVWSQVGKIIGFDLDPAKLASMDDLLAGEIWERRLNYMERLIDLRGQHGDIPDGGHRHQFLWLAANAYAWVNRGHLAALKKDIAAWADMHTPSFSSAERNGVITTVLKRAKEQQGWDTGLYRLSETEFKLKLAVTPIEADCLARSSKDIQIERWNIGAMGFPPMRGLSFDNYTAETTRRQQEAAHRTNAMARAARALLREKALLLRLDGLKERQIAEKLGVSNATAHRWLKTS